MPQNRLSCWYYVMCDVVFIEIVVLSTLLVHIIHNNPVSMHNLKKIPEQ